MNLFAAGDGNTPLSPDEQLDLIPDLTSKEELNEWERQNILEAYGWALDKRNLDRLDPLSESYVRQLHLRMFDQTWKWAGVYRTTEKNIGIPYYQLRDALRALIGDTRYWLEHKLSSRMRLQSAFITAWYGFIHSQTGTVATLG